MAANPVKILKNWKKKLFKKLAQKVTKLKKQ